MWRVHAVVFHSSQRTYRTLIGIVRLNFWSQKIHRFEVVGQSELYFEENSVLTYPPPSPFNALIVGIYKNKSMVIHQWHQTGDCEEWVRLPNHQFDGIDESPLQCSMDSIVESTQMHFGAPDLPDLDCMTAQCDTTDRWMHAGTFLSSWATCSMPDLDLTIARWISSLNPYKCISVQNSCPIWIQRPLTTVHSDASVWIQRPI